MASRDPRDSLRARLAEAAAQVAAEREGGTRAPAPAAPAPEPVETPEPELAPARRRPPASRARPVPLEAPELAEDVQVATPRKAAGRAKKAPAVKKAAAVAPKKAAVAKRAPAGAAKKTAVAKKAAVAPRSTSARRPAVSRAAPPPLDVPVPDVDEEQVDYEPPTEALPRWRAATETPPPSEPAPAEPTAWQPPVSTGASEAPTTAVPAAAPAATPPPAPSYTQPQPPKRGGLRSVGIVIGVAVIAALVVLGLVIGIGKLLGGGGVKYSELKAGDCFQRPSGRFKNVTTVACTKSHDLEVYAVLDHPAGPKDAFPGMDELVRYASPLCLAQFQAYAGVPFEQLNLQDVYITPRDSAWKDGARKLVCAVGAQNDQPSTKSIRARA